MNDDDEIPDILKRLVAELEDAGATVIVNQHDVEEPDENTPENVVDNFRAFLQRRVTAGTLTVDHIDLAADICLHAADQCFTKDWKNAGDIAGRTVTGLDSVSDLAFNVEYRLSRDAFGAALIKRRGSDTGRDGAGTAFLEAAQILREALPELELPELGLN